MEYRAIYTGQEDLEHGLFGRKGSQKKNHKYLMREWVNNKWKYYYTQAQIQAKKLGSKVTGKNNSKEIKKLENAAASAKKSSEKAGKEFSKAAKNTGKSLSKAISNGEKKTKKILDNIGNKSSKKENKRYIAVGVESVKGSGALKQLLGVGMENSAYAKAYGEAAAKDVKNLNFGSAITNAKKAVSFISDNRTALDRYNATTDLLVNKKINAAKYSKKK